MALLSVDQLNVRFDTSDGVVHAVRGLSFEVNASEVLAIVGESGSGKSQSAFAIMGLLASNGNATGSVQFKGDELLNKPTDYLNRIRATGIAMVFQDALAALNPYMRIADQMTEVLVYHFGLSQREALAQSIAMLDAVRIPDAKNRIRLFPHEFSGGMQQRVMIAMALLCKPALLIADEPTTALDVTVQAEIMDLLAEVRREMNMSMILITHDLGVVAGYSDTVMVLYAGQVVESAPVQTLFDSPGHPYTIGLLNSILRLDTEDNALYAIPGTPPNLLLRQSGCPFVERCEFAIERCHSENPALNEYRLENVTRSRACHVEINS